MEVPTRTPTETLMAALAECETADNVLIILRHKGEISWHHTLGCTHELMGLLQFVLTVSKGELMREVMNDYEEDEDD
jgi:hypothetical protein